MKKIKPNMVRMYFWIVFAIGLLTGLLGATSESVVVTVIGIVLILAGLAFYIICYRCPHCGKFLDRHTGEFCPFCGKKVNE